MSNKTPETIWKFESPEALAQALEDKNKALAERVREISKKSIATDSKDLRKALQEELSPTEQKEMREALPDAGISEVFTKWMTTEEKAIQEAKNSAWEMLWEDNTKALQKVEWIWNRLSTGMDKIGDIFEQKWMMAGIWAIILMIKWIFSWDFSALDSILNPKKEDEKKESENKWNEKVDQNNMLNMKIFIEYTYKWDNKDNILNIAQKPNFKKLTIKEIKEINSNDSKLDSWIKETYWETKIDKSHVKSTFELFTNWKWNEIFHRILWKNYNENLTINEAFQKVWKDLFIFEHVSSLNPQDLLKEWWEIARFDIKDFTNWEPPKLFSERKITKDLWIFILSSKYNIWDNTESLLANTTLKKQEQDKLREIISFWEKIQSEMTSNSQINLWLWDKIKTAFLNSPMTLVEMTKMYVILWWETNFSEMNEFKQSFMYFSVGSLLDKTHRSNWTQWEYIIKLADLIKDGVEWKASNIPVWVIDFMWSIGNWIMEYLESALIDWGVTFAGWFKETIKKYPWLLAVLVWIVLIYPWTERRTILWKILPKFWWKLNK